MLPMRTWLILGTLDRARARVCVCVCVLPRLWSWMGAQLTCSRACMLPCMLFGPNC
jgi:hypothetical protein